MDEFLTMIGVLFFTFLVLAAAVEAIVEVLRGIVEFIPADHPLKPRISLDDAIKTGAEFADTNTMLAAKVASISKLVEQVKGLGPKVRDLENALAKQGNEAPAAVSAVVADIKRTLDGKDRLKIMILRGLAAVIGCLVVWFAKANLFNGLPVESPALKALLAPVQGGDWSDIASILLGGLAAAAGSSYWHDQLDRVRKVKEIGQQLTAVVQQK